VGKKLGYATVEVLRAVRDGLGYGLDVMDRTGLASGTVYPTLRRLERRGFVQARWEGEAQARREGRPRRCYYRVTRAGRDALAEALRAYRALSGTGPAGDAQPEEGC
jgi:PadR family transcriptional regulator PadR